MEQQKNYIIDTNVLLEEAKSTRTSSLRGKNPGDR
jgi:hypothetical protein